MSAPRPAPSLRLRGLELTFGARTYIMGILNVTPDSFSGDGLLQAAATLPPAAAVIDRAVEQARAMVEQGADILDIGGESTRPGHEPVTVEEESGRVVDIIAAVRAALPGVPISIDTSKERVAAAALEAGADMLNDVAAVTSGTALAPIAARSGAPYVLMHARRHPDYRDVVAEVVDDLARALAAAEAAGCAPGSLIVDPGIGFGKTVEHNLLLLRELSALRSLGRPILLGTSRKSTIGRVLDLPPEARLEGTLATTALGIAAGADIIRVHDVEPNVRVARMSDAIIRDTWQGAARASQLTDPPAAP